MTESFLEKYAKEYEHKIALSNQHCPTCGLKVLESQRYPQYLCDTCANEAVDRDNNRVSFTDEIDGHSLKMRYVDGHLPDVTFNPARDNSYPHVWVRGTECEVQVAHFGGIVMIPVA